MASQPTTCTDCKTRPVDKSTQGRDSAYCTQCFDYASWENTHSDNSHEDRFQNPTIDGIDPELTDCPVCHPELDPRNVNTDQTTTEADQLPSGSCHCRSDCPASTDHSFAPGHDAKMVSLLVQDVMAGTQTLSDATWLVRQAGGTEALVAKLVRAIDNQQAIRDDKSARDIKRMSALVQAVQDHARDHYEEGGWDVVVEGWSAAEIHNKLTAEGVTGKRAAIRSFKGAVSVWAERQAEAANERESAGF